QYKDSLLLVTSITETGYAEARRSIPGADYYAYLPIDFRWVIAPIVRRVRPDVVILAESDYWYNFLECCKDVGAKVAVVNARISERSVGRFLQFPSFSKILFSFIDLFCVQNDALKSSFERLGIPK